MKLEFRAVRVQRTTHPDHMLVTLDVRTPANVRYPSLTAAGMLDVAVNGNPGDSLETLSERAISVVLDLFAHRAVE
jgi:hypothetical protein